MCVFFIECERIVEVPFVRFVLKNFTESQGSLIFFFTNLEEYKDSFCVFFKECGRSSGSFVCFLWILKNLRDPSVFFFTNPTEPQGSPVFFLLILRISEAPCVSIFKVSKSYILSFFHKHYAISCLVY